MAFAIPELLNSDDNIADDELRAKIRGMEPDVCIAVTRKGGKAEEVPRIYAVK